MDLWGVAVGAVVASLAWIYQRSWEHQEKRMLMYRAIIDSLPNFMEGQLDSDGMNKALIEGRRLWLSAPDDVVQSYERLLDVAEGRTTDPCALGKCISAMRRDSTYSAVLFPRFWRTKLTNGDFRVRTAKQLPR